MTLLIILLVSGLIVFYGLRLTLKEKHRKKKQMDLARAYDRLVARHQLSIEHAEVVGNRVLALDRRNKKLLVVDHSEAGNQEQCISLTGITDSRIVKEKNAQGHIKKLWLQLKPKRSEKIYRASFFDEEKDALIDLPRFSRQAHYWKSRVDNHRHPGTVDREHIESPNNLFYDKEI